MHVASRTLLLPILLLATTASAAAPDELADRAIELAKNASAASGGKQLGEVLKGYGKSVDWNVDLTSGQCYSFGLKTTDKKVVLTLMAPGNAKTFEEKAKDMELLVNHCASLTGTYKLTAKPGGASEVRVAIFATPKPAGDPLTDRAIGLAKKAAAETKPEAKQLGEVLNGSGKQVEWHLTLEAGQCYWFGGETTGKSLAMYLWDPGDHKVADDSAKQPELLLTFCATVNGNYKLRAKPGPASEVRVAVFGKLKPADMPDPKADKEKAALAPSLPCHDEAADGAGSLSIACAGDCKAMDLFVDGQRQTMPQGTTSWQVDGMTTGCHTLKVDAWTGLFHHELWYDGRASVAANMVTRYEARAGKFELVGKGKIAPPAPAAPAVSAEAIGDALEDVKDAIDYNKDEDSRCQSKLSGKLESIRDMLNDLRHGSGDLDLTTRKLNDTIAWADEDCPKRTAGTIRKKLNKALDALRH